VTTHIIPVPAGSPVRRPAGRWLLATLLVSLGGCSGQVKDLGDGRYSVDCPGGYHDWTRCNRAARNTCGEGNVEVDTRTSDEAGDVGTKDWSSEGTVVSRRMIFHCRANRL
jgi:hypothetical protein